MKIDKKIIWEDYFSIKKVNAFRKLIAHEEAASLNFMSTVNFAFGMMFPVGANRPEIYHVNTEFGRNFDRACSMTEANFERYLLVIQKKAIIQPRVVFFVYKTPDEQKMLDTILDNLDKNKLSKPNHLKSVRILQDLNMAGMFNPRFKTIFWREKDLTEKPIQGALILDHSISSPMAISNYIRYTSERVIFDHHTKKLIFTDDTIYDVLTHNRTMARDRSLYDPT